MPASTTFVEVQADVQDVFDEDTVADVNDELGEMADQYNFIPRSKWATMTRE